MALAETLGKPEDAKSFGEYFVTFAKPVSSQFNGQYPRTDVVFDRYKQLPIKDSTRKCRDVSRRGVKWDISNGDPKVA